MGIVQLRLKWMEDLWLKWVGHSWLKWVGQLWQSDFEHYSVAYFDGVTVWHALRNKNNRLIQGRSKAYSGPE